jgi:hypothetical protein
MDDAPESSSAHLEDSYCVPSKDMNRGELMVRRRVSYIKGSFLFTEEIITREHMTIQWILASKPHIQIPQEA